VPGPQDATLQQQILQSAIEGTYDVRFTNGGGMFVPEYTGTIEMRYGGCPPARFTRDNCSVDPTIDADLSFAYDGQDSSGSHVRLAGRFAQESGNAFLTSGSWETTFSTGAQKTCAHDLSGAKR
jgi:hypothetical protein